MNQIKSFLLLGGLTMLMVSIGSLIGGQQGMLIAFILALAINFFSYWCSDRIVLRAYKAQPVSEAEAPELMGMVRSLAIQADLPMPRVCIIPSDTPNAFATGRNPQHAVVAVTRGIVNLLNARELRGVLAHELAHVKNRDILIGSIAATLAGAIMMLANFARFGAILGNGRDNAGRGGGAAILLIMSILAPLAAMLIQMAVSRSREFMADASGAAISQDSQALASALAKLEQFNQARPLVASPQTAHMFIVNPLSGGGLSKLFSTHPPISERIARLQAIDGPRLDDRERQAAVRLPGTPPPLHDYGYESEERPRQSGQGGKIDWS